LQLVVHGAEHFQIKPEENDDPGAAAAAALGAAVIGATAIGAIIVIGVNI
jgi:hypothetical protein